MINAAMLLSIVLLGVFNNALAKGYAIKMKGKGAYTKTFLTCFSIAMVFLALSFPFEYSTDVLPYSLAFSITFTGASFFSFMAISSGPISLTTLFSNYSMLITMAYGMIFLKEIPTISFVIGLVIAIAVIFIVNKKSDDSTVTSRWWVFVILALCFSSGNQILQTMCQRRFGGAYNTEFMAVAILISSVPLLLVTLKKEGKETVEYIKKGWLLCVLSGALIGPLNLLTMILSGRMSVSIMFPVISVASLTGVALMSKFVFKERITKSQTVGFILGVISILLMNL